jgi:hypothetical protein
MRCLKWKYTERPSMPAPIDPIKLQEALRALGIFPADLEALRRIPLEEARRCLDVLKERVRKNYKQLAFELHPDRTGNDPTKTERFMLLGSVKDEFEKLQLQQQQPQLRQQIVMRVVPPMPQVRVMRVVTWSSAGSAHINATTGTVSIGVPFRVATMKPT